MNVLLVGGSGHVGTMALPYLKAHHRCRILDLRPPTDTSVEYIQSMGDVVDVVDIRIRRDVGTFVTLHPFGKLDRLVGKEGAGFRGGWWVGRSGLPAGRH